MNWLIDIKILVAFSYITVCNSITVSSIVFSLHIATEYCVTEFYNEVYFKIEKKNNVQKVTHQELL